MVADAIVLWNATYFEATMQHLNTQGRSAPPDLLQHIFPLGGQQTNLTDGVYWWPKDTAA